MNIQTERLELIPCTPDSYMAHYRQYEMGLHVHMHLEQLHEDPETLGWGIWFAQRRSDGKLIGDIGFKGKPDEQQAVEIGYGILPEARQQGFAAEAAKALIGWAFAGGRVATVKAECYPDNLPSIKVLEKLGMERIAESEEIIYWEKRK